MSATAAAAAAEPNSPLVPDIDQARAFLGMLAADDATFTFQTFDDSDLARGDLAKVVHGTLDEHHARLAAWNGRGGGIFVTVNETDGLGRKAENVTHIRAVFADLDGAPLRPVLTCALEPHLVVETSPGRFHAYWLVDGLPLDQFTLVQKAIAARFGGDASVCDLPRVLRVPGYWHRKGEPFLVHVHGMSDRLPYRAERILAEFPPTGAQKANGHDEHAPTGDREMAELARRIMTGEEYHDALRDLAYRYVKAGMASGQVVETLRGIMEATPDETRDARWSARRAEIPRLVSSAEAKLAGTTPHPAQALLNKLAAAPASAPDKPGWPEPLQAEAFHGIAGDVVRAIEPHSEADPAALLLQFLSAFGNAVGRGPYIQVEGDRHPTQIWAVIVGETSKGRKGTSWGRIRQLFESAASVWTVTRVADGGLSSGEGLIWQVRDPIIKRTTDKKTGEIEEETIDEGVDDKRLFVLEAEFAGALRQVERAGNTLSSTLRCFWDRGNVSALTKNSPARTTNSLVSIVGHVSIDELRRYMTRTEAANGLANRFLFTCTRRSKSLLFGGGELDLAALANMIADRLGWAEARGDLRTGWTDGARDIWVKVYPELSDGRPGMLGAATSRAEAQVLRLALVYAVLDRSAFLEPAHLRAALAVWKYCDASAAFIFGDSLGDPVADEIRRALVAAPDGLTRNDLRNMFSRHESSESIGRALDQLAERGLARSENRPTRGRPEERWYAQ